MSIQPSSSPAHAGPVNVGPSVSTSAPAVDEEGVAPSRRMELWLGVIVVLSLGTSIVGIAFVYGFNTTNLLTPQNIVPAVRATIADSLMLLGTYFSRRFLTRPQKTRWHKQWGAFWLLVALGATCFSWICNVLAVNEVGTVITVALLNKSGLGWLDVNLVNQIIAALPIVAVLIYAFVPRHPKHVQRVVDTRTPEQIREDWEREQALLQVDIQRQQLLAAQRGQGVGSIIAAARAGLFAGLGRDEAEQRTERQMADQMRVLLVKHGYKSDDQAHKMKDREVRLLAEALGLWDVASNTPTAKALGPTYAEHLAELRKEAVRRGWLTPEQIAEERDLFPPDITLRYDGIEAELSQAREEEARQAALEAEAERQRREEEARASAEVGSPGPASFPPAAPGTDTQDRPSPQASAPLATRRDGFTPQELADRLGKSRGTILGWMQLGAAGPLKIFPEEVYLDERGHRRIMPAVYLRLSRVLESQQHKGVGTRRVSRVSDPSMPAVTAETPGAEQQNGKHPETNEWGLPLCKAVNNRQKMLSGVAYRQCHPRPIFNDFFSRAKVSAPIACWCYSLRQMAAKMCEAAVSIMAAGICQSFTRQGVKNNRKEVPILQVTPLYLTSIHECESSRQGSSCCTPTTHDAPARRASSPSLMGLHCFSLVDFLPG